MTTRRNERLRKREAGLHRAIEEAKGFLLASRARFKPALTGKARRSSKRRRGTELLAEYRIAKLSREAIRVKARIEGKKPKEAKP